MRLLVGYAQARTHIPPERLDLADLDAEMIGAFLDHLEADRHNSIDTRNLRLTAIHSLFRYAQLRCPEHAALIARVLVIPTKASALNCGHFPQRQHRLPAPAEGPFRAEFWSELLAPGPTMRGR